MHSSRSSWILSCLITAICAGNFTGCSTAQRQADASKESKATADSAEDDAFASRAQLNEMQVALNSMTSRLDSIETRMGSLNDKVIGSQTSLEMLMSNRKALASPVHAHPSEGAGTETPVPAADNDPEAGFVADSAIQEYRKGAILLEAQKYPEALLAFSSFVERYPDHPLAGSAQYNIGKSYFKQKEYKLALRELERVLTSYDRSPHISDTLKHLAETEDALKMPEQATRHRQLLTSLFAQSPAASAPLKDVPTAPAPTAPLTAPVMAPPPGAHEAP